ncbi:MAG: ATP-binding cassette domain-containing protein [Bacteroidia bacterium]
MADTKQPIIHVAELSKYFGNTKALDGLHLEVQKGEIHGFLGPNGSGKTTTIRVLLGLLQKNSGDIQLFGKNPWEDAVELHKRLAYVPGDVNLWDNFTGDEVIELLAKMRGNINYDKKKELVERFGLDTSKKCRSYSKGNRQKVALISAFVSDVELYILDEPTSGLDPLMEEIFKETVKNLAKEGKTVLLSSHILSEVEALCDRITIIRNGKTVESGSLVEMRHLTRLNVSFTTEKKVGDLSQFSDVFDLKVSENTTEFSIEGNQLNAVLQYLTQFGITSMTSHQPTLEELFLHVYHNK